MKAIKWETVFLTLGVIAALELIITLPVLLYLRTKGICL